MGKVSPGQYFCQFMTLNWKDSDVLVHVENIRLLEMIRIRAERMESKTYKNWPSEEVKITNYMERVGIEAKIESMQKDGSQSWSVISRGIDQYVTELPEENEKPTTKKWFPMRRNPVQEQFIPSSSSFSTTVLPIGQQIWNDIPMENPSSLEEDDPNTTKSRPSSRK